MLSCQSRQTAFDPEIEARLPEQIDFNFHIKPILSDRCFTIWVAGAGVKKGMIYGATDDFSYNITENPVHVHDFQATMLHLLGVDHEKLTFKPRAGATV